MVESFADALELDRHTVNRYLEHLERAYLDGLGAVNRYEISGNTLTLYADDDRLLVFEAAQP